MGKSLEWSDQTRTRKRVPKNWPDKYRMSQKVRPTSENKNGTLWKEQNQFYDGDSDQVSDKEFLCYSENQCGFSKLPIPF